MALVPWSKRDGERPVTSLQREMNHLFDDFLNRGWLAVEPFRGMKDWVPALDISETEEAVVVKAELPGLEQKDVEVTLSGDLLTIKGEKKEEKEEKSRHFHRVERSYGSFERNIQLPTDVKADKVKASFKNGVLVVELPKAEQTKSKSVKINVE